MNLIIDFVNFRSTC